MTGYNELEAHLSYSRPRHPQPFRVQTLWSRMESRRALLALFAKKHESVVGL